MILQQGTHTFTGQAGQLKYRYQQGTSDRRHLLVIFSGFRNKGTLDFGGAAIEAIRHNILWIYDEFGGEGENSYYLLEKGRMVPRDTVLEFLEEVREAYDLTWQNMTFAGFSKGGSAALYFGLTLGAGAVISAVPQFYIGRYVRKNWPKPFDFMRAGKDTDAEQAEMDALMPDLLREHREAPTHVYILTSPADHQLAEEIQPQLENLRGLKNFNLITTESHLITQHNEVTAYNVPEIFGFFQLTAAGLFPQLGETQTKQETSEALARLQRQKREGVAVLEDLKVSSNGRFTLDLVTLIRGVAQPDYSSMYREAQVRAPGQEPHILNLGKKIDPAISRRYVQDTFIDYRTARSVSVRDAGYEIDALPQGISTLHVSMKGKSASSSVQATVTANRPISRCMATNKNAFRALADSKGTSLEVRSLKDFSARQGDFFALDSLELNEANRLSLRGWYAPLGTTIEDWGSAAYYVYLEGAESSYSFPLGMLDRLEEAQKLGLPNSLRKAYFCDIKNEGVDLSDVVEGTYQLHVLMLNKDVLAKSQPIAELDISGAETQPPVAVLGSCIVRDVFNSKFISDWKNRNELTAAAHQSALVSLTSEPYQGPEITASDLDKHSKQCVDEDLSKSVMANLLANPPEWIFIDLFSDARFGVRDVDGRYITDNAWKIGTSSDFATIKNYPVISMHKNPERYLELFRESLRKLRTMLDEAGANTKIALVKVRATEQLRDGLGNVDTMPGPQGVLNSAFEPLEEAFVEELPDATILDLTQHNTWANKNHPWSAYVVHYEQAFYRAEDQAFRNLLGTQRQVRLTIL